MDKRHGFVNRDPRDDVRGCGNAHVDYYGAAVFPPMRTEFVVVYHNADIALDDARICACV